MQANPFASLPGNLGARAAAVVEARELRGYNVHYLDDRGQRARVSLATRERVDLFGRYLASTGRAAIVPMGGEFYVYLGDSLKRVCPSIGMAFEVAEGLESGNA